MLLSELDVFTTVLDGTMAMLELCIANKCFMMGVTT